MVGAPDLALERSPARSAEADRDLSAHLSCDGRASSLAIVRRRARHAECNKAWAALGVGAADGEHVKVSMRFGSPLAARCMTPRRSRRAHDGQRQQRQGSGLRQTRPSRLTLSSILEHWFSARASQSAAGSIVSDVSGGPGVASAASDAAPIRNARRRIAARQLVGTRGAEGAMTLAANCSAKPLRDRPCRARDRIGDTSPRRCEFRLRRSGSLLPTPPPCRRGGGWQGLGACGLLSWFRRRRASRFYGGTRQGCRSRDHGRDHDG